MATEIRFKVVWNNQQGLERESRKLFRTRKEAQESVKTHMAWLEKLGYDMPIYRIVQIERAIVRRKRDRQALEGDGAGDLRSTWMRQERTDGEE